MSPSSRSDGRRSQDQIEEAWWAKQLGHDPEPAAAAEHETERRTATDPEVQAPAIVEAVRDEAAAEPPAVDVPPSEEPAPPPVRRSYVRNYELARRSLALVGPILLGVVVAWLVVMITR